MEVSMAMARLTGRVGRRRSRRCGERGAQALEWIALGSFVTTIMAGATVYARDHGADIGSLLVNHLHGFLSQ
jgi:hypothetical protein